MAGRAQRDTPDTLFYRLTESLLRLRRGAVLVVLTLPLAVTFALQHRCARGQTTQVQRLGPTPTTSVDAADWSCPEVDLGLVARSAACASGGAYPRCTWTLPSTSNDYRIWRNTTPEHRSARAELVTTILRVARGFAALHPNANLQVGDLDAPGPRHQTHNEGIDVDLYLPEAMIVRNDGGGHFIENYVDRSPVAVAAMRSQVLDLAKLLAVCTHGDLRIYYNDDPVREPFLAWYAARGLNTRFAAPMMNHNALHRFHFHVRIGVGPR